MINSTCACTCAYSNTCAWIEHEHAATPTSMDATETLPPPRAAPSPSCPVWADDFLRLLTRACHCAVGAVWKAAMASTRAASTSWVRAKASPSRRTTRRRAASRTAAWKSDSRRSPRRADFEFHPCTEGPVGTPGLFVFEEACLPPFGAGREALLQSRTHTRLKERETASADYRAYPYCRSRGPYGSTPTSPASGDACRD